jgi:PAS domain-containing protein
MAVASRVRGRVGVKTWAKATNYVANEVFRVWLIILSQRGQNNAGLLQQREVINNGLFTWLATHHLKKAILEIFQPSSSEAVERWDMEFTYANPTIEDIADEDEVDEVWKTYLDEITPFMARMKALPAGTLYRVVVDLEDEVDGIPPPPVSGWEAATLRNIDHLQQQKFGEVIKVDGLINVGMGVWGRW